MPQRIQRKRTKGWRMPEDAVYVGSPTIYANPHRHLRGMQLAVDMYQRDLARGALGWPGINRPLTCDLIRSELAGRNLACWCPLGQPCHADLLLEIANGVADAR